MLILIGYLLLFGNFLSFLVMIVVGNYAVAALNFIAVCTLIYVLSKQ